MLEKRVKKTYLGLGSNLGNKKNNIEYAKFLLQQNKKFKIHKTSSFYKTKSWPNNNNPFFLNIVIEGFSFAPSESKRNYMFELNTIITTMKLVN